MRIKELNKTILLVCAVLIIFFSINSFLFSQEKTSFPEELTGEQLYQEGLQFFQQKKYQQAVLYFEEAIKRKPNFSEAHYHLGRCYIKLIDPENARRNLVIAKILSEEDAVLKKKVISLLEQLPKEIEKEKKTQNEIKTTDIKDENITKQKDILLSNSNEITKSLSKIDLYKLALKQKVTIEEKQISVQYAIISILKQVGVPYQWNKSAELADPERRRWVQVQIHDLPAEEAITNILVNVGLSYEIEDAGLYLKRNSEKNIKTIINEQIQERDWNNLFKRRSIEIYVSYEQVTDSPWTDVNNKTWNVIKTQYFKLYFQPSADQVKVRKLAEYIDNIYSFLEGRLGVKRIQPIKAFLIPGESGRSRWSSENDKYNAMRTGDNGDFLFNITSFMHEATHMFDAQFLGHPGGGWWEGEYMCGYFQQRMKLMGRGIDFKQYYQERLRGKSLPSWSFLNNPSKPTQGLEWKDIIDFDAAITIPYFLEEKYGTKKLNEFWRECLLTYKTLGIREYFEHTFQKVFGKPITELENEWRKYWTTPIEKNNISTSNLIGKPTKYAFEVVKELASSKYRGRKTGATETLKAAEYIANQYSLLGLEYARGMNTYFQEFKVKYSDIIGPIELEIVNPHRVFEYGKDFGVLTGNDGQWVQSNVVFVGYGIVSGPRNDYAGIDVRGKIALAFSKTPDGIQTGNRIYSAEKAGALALFLMDCPGEDDLKAYARKNINVRNSIVAVHISSKVASEILNISLFDLANLKKETDTGNIIHKTSNRIIKVCVGTSYPIVASARNVISCLRPQSCAEKNKFVLVCAHYDGQGVDIGQSYYPSANDNASGVGVLLEVAKNLADETSRLKIPILFACWAGEEQGTLGSEYFIENYKTLTDSIIGVINMDMVGQGDGTVLIQNYNQEMPLFKSVVETILDLGFQYRRIPRERLGSDARVFQLREIPTVFLLQGDKNWHTLLDTPENVNLENLSVISTVLTETLLRATFLKSR